MIDLNKLVDQSLAKIDEEGFVAQVVEKRLKETITGIVDNLFSRYSDFGEELKTEVAGQLKIDLKDLNLAGYNTMVLNVVKEKLDEAVHIQGVERIKKSLDDLLMNVKSEYKLSELIEEMKEIARDDGDDFEGEEISFHIAPDRSILTHIYFDEEPHKERYQCKYIMWINTKTSILAGAEIRGTKFDNRVIMGGLRGFEETLFKLFVSKPKIVIDDDNVDIEYGYRGDD